ncbi:hypothetical protein HanHA300_Chr02g0058921 [Helianthus annuus]|nr:hypothetical protein HanHA300_Chr02g0058921 [Helianthus annuus]KAJ0619097.1 hypothetical protein HanHA89_Chr02g0067471 [Helianthus annuus]KAJ0777546.1 hypothetical protein HanLR1_Chr02g0061671 [Helianthus annuus]
MSTKDTYIVKRLLYNEVSSKTKRFNERNFMVCISAASIYDKTCLGVTSWYQSPGLRESSRRR